MRANWLCAWILGGLTASCGSVQEVKTHGNHEHGVAGHHAGDDDDDDGDGADDDADETEEDVALADVPAALKKAAEAAVPGLVLERAEKETEGGSVHYCLHGQAGGESVEVEVDLAGKVLEIERGEDEDED